MGKTLTRNRTHAMIGGVCAGLAQYLNIDVSLVRFFFILLAIWGGVGTLIYIILWIVLPAEGEEAGDNADFSARTRQVGQEFGEAFSRPNPQAGTWIGITLVLAGAMFLLRNLELPWLAWLDKDITWPILLIFGGAYLLFRAVRGR